MFLLFIFRIVDPLIVVLHRGNLYDVITLAMLSMTILFESFVEISKPNVG